MAPLRKKIRPHNNTETITPNFTKQWICECGKKYVNKFTLTRHQKSVCAYHGNDFFYSYTLNA